MRLSILHIAETGGWAGGETYLLEVARRLDRARFRLVVAVPESGPLLENLAAERIETVLLPLAPLVSPAPVLRLARLLRERGIDVVQSQGARTNLYARIAGRLAGTPAIISTVHNSLLDYPVPAWRKRLYLMADTRTARLAHATVCIAESHRRELLARYRVPPESIVTILNGIDPARYRPDGSGPSVRRSLSLPDDAAILAVVGRLTDQKGHRFLIDALPAIIAKQPSVICVIIGDGELRQHLERQAGDRGVARHCRFLGVRKDVKELLAAVDVVVLPSRSEGLPYAAMEAMAMARPVVAAAVSGVPELVRDGVTGRLVPKEDASALADAVLDVLGNPERAAAMGEAGRRRIEAEFTADRWIMQLQQLYTRLLPPCPCGESRMRPVTAATDLLVRCARCGLLMRQRMPSEAETAASYDTAYWPRYRDEQTSDARDNVYRHAVDALEQVHPARGRLIDVGCGGGRFLSIAQARGWHATGFERSSQAVEHAAAQGLSVAREPFPPCRLPDGSVDAVTFINVLDHLPDPFAALREAHRVLRPGGWLYVRVIHGPFHLRLLRWRRLARLAVFHLYGFSRRSLRHHLSRMEFESIVIRTAPPARHDPYAAGNPVVASVKRLDRLVFRALDAVGLDRAAWGPTVECLARKSMNDSRLTSHGSR